MKNNIGNNHRAVILGGTHLWCQMGEKLLLDLNKRFLLCTAVPKIYCLTEKTGLQDSLSVKHNTKRWESVKNIITALMLIMQKHSCMKCLFYIAYVYAFGCFFKLKISLVGVEISSIQSSSCNPGFLSSIDGDNMEETREGGGGKQRRKHQ